MQRQQAGPFGERDRGLQAICEKRAVRQVGQRIVMRHVGDQRLGAALFGDVKVGRDETAAGERHASYLDDGAVRPCPLIDMRLTLAHQPHAPGDMLLDVAGAVFAPHGVEAEQSFQRRKAVGEEFRGVVEQNFCCSLQSTICSSLSNKDMPPGKFWTTASRRRMRSRSELT